MDDYFDQLPYQQPVVHYNKKSEILNIPLVINFAITCATSEFESMENMILKNIPKDFTKSFLKLFENQYAYKVQLISSFVRSTDLSIDLNCEDGQKDFSIIIGGLPVTNFELNNNSDVIPYDTFKSYTHPNLKFPILTSEKSL